MQPPRLPVVLLNSLATTGLMWSDVIGALPSSMAAVTLDQRDQRTGSDAAPFTLDDLVEDAIAAMDAAGVERAHLAGVSLGGMVSLHAAAARPDRFVSATAMCCAARFPESVWLERARAVRAAGLAPHVEAILERWFTEPFRVANRSTMTRFRSMLEQSPADGYAFASDLLAVADVTAELPSISIPTMVVSGALDPANPVEHQQAIAAGVPGAEHVVIDGGGHLLPASHPHAVAELIAGHASKAERLGWGSV